MSEILQAKIASVRRKSVIVAVATGVAAAIGVFVLVLAVSMMLDFWWSGAGLPFTARAALLALNLAAVVWILLYAVFGPVLYGPDDDEIALMVEDAEPAFRTRLIASVQLSRDGAAPADASSSLIRAMIAQAESLAGPMDFGRVIKTEPLVRTIMLCLLCLVVTGGVFAWGGDASRALLKRAFLATDTPVPRKTRVTPITTNLLIAKGDDVDIFALAEGVTPDDPAKRKLRIRTIPDDKSVSARKQDFNLDPVKPDPKRLADLKEILRARDAAKSTDPIAAKLTDNALLYGATVTNVQESFDYTLRLNDGESEKFTVTVRPRPAITKVEAKQVYPAYTNKGVEPRGLGDLALLKGSKLQLAVTVNKNLRRPTPKDQTPNFVHLIGSDKDVPLAVDPKSPNLLTGEVEIPKGTTGFSVNLTSDDGLKSKDPAVYRIDLVDDKAPTVRIVFPTRKEVALVREGKQKIIFEALDDFAIGGAAIKYRIDEGSESTVKLDLKGTPKSFRGEYTWRLTEIQPPNPAKPTLEGSVIEYWVEVEDTKDAANGGANRGVSDHYMIRIVSEDQLREILRTRIADIGSGLRTAADDQENVANKVQTILLEKKVEPTTPKK